MRNETIKEKYYQNEEYADDLLCAVITTIIEIPEVRRAVLVAALDSDFYMANKGLETVGDLPFQILWDHIMGQEEIRTTLIRRLMIPEKE